VGWIILVSIVMLVIFFRFNYIAGRANKNIDEMSKKYFDELKDKQK